MSRIHEALKKAEQERAAVVTAEADAGALPTDSSNAAPKRIGSKSVRDEDLVSRAVVNTPPSSDYLRFDDLRARCSHPEWHLDPNVNVFVNPALGAHGAEQFRTLRSRLYQLRSNQPLRTLLVTSSIPTEGKTFVTNNLAQAIVRQPDRRALIIDADLRRSRLHVPLGAPSSPGLTDYLRGKADAISIIQQGQEGNLCFIPGGNEVTNPSELLSNGRLRVLLDRVKTIFDWVILDSPPCLLVADASVLADNCDGILLVTRAGVTPAATAQRATQELRGRNVVGVVLNAVKETHSYHSSYYYGYGHGYGDAKDSNK
ncbi:MAG: CpsD/CapB family tyrosine-protein kinase [Candidatus Acidiferrales bacterium]